MKTANILTIDGSYAPYEYYDVKSFPFERLNKEAQKCKHHKYAYCWAFGTFDIESTTYFDETSQTYKGIMYHWQACVGWYVAVGRTWEEWRTFRRTLIQYLDISPDRRFVWYVQNLGFEYEWIRPQLGEHQFLAVKPHKILNVHCVSGEEYRCSYLLSNMSLEGATMNQMGVRYIKASGDLDYSKLRTSSTRLTAKELGYCVSDVVSLYDYISNKMKEDKDDLESIPLTSTGYVRRDVRRSCRKYPNYMEFFQSLWLHPAVYKLLKEAGRGGDTHANRHLAGRIIADCDAYDVVSSYIYVLCCKRFPMTTFSPYGPIGSREELDSLVNTKACLFRVILKDVHVKDSVAMPYISSSKCKVKTNTLLDNGRIMSADELLLTLTDIDWKIILEQYDIKGGIEISDMYTAEYGYLPSCITDVAKQYFTYKCHLDWELRHCSDPKRRKILKYRYDKIKSKLNSIFGMMFMDPIREEHNIKPDGKWETIKIQDDEIIQEKLEKYRTNRNNFLYYPWGTWTTAHARAHLARLVKITGAFSTIYCDTDSDYCMTGYDEEINAENLKIMEEAREHGAYYTIEGNTYYMGIYEKKNKTPLKGFITLGAKKYAYEDEEGIHVTVSGVSKRYGAQELKTLENFKVGFEFKKAGGSTLFYNPMPRHEVTLEGVTMENYSNVALVDRTYKLGLDGPYSDLIGYDNSLPW